MINFSVEERESYSVVHIQIDGIIQPDALKNISPPKVKGNRGVVISGRGPVWIYGFLVHHYHPTKWVGIYDPRLGGAVVVETHSDEVQVGDVIRVDLGGDGDV